MISLNHNPVLAGASEDTSFAHEIICYNKYIPLQCATECFVELRLIKTLLILIFFSPSYQGKGSPLSSSNC